MGSRVTTFPTLPSVALEFFDATRLFAHCVQGGLISPGEVARFWKLIETECQENEEVVFILCKMLKQSKRWDNEALCRNLISSENLEDVEKKWKPASEEGVSLRMLYEVLPQMAV
jgi:hypothetical protein